MELLKIEKELKTRGEEAMREYDAKLIALTERLDAALRVGLPPNEFPRAGELKEAIVTARKLLRLQVKGG